MVWGNYETKVGGVQASSTSENTSLHSLCPGLLPVQEEFTERGGVGV